MPGWRTDRKIVVFESDDWGTIRMRSKEVLNKLVGKGYPLNKCTYNSNDTLENNTDLRNLLEILHSVKDGKNNPAIFTLNNIVANPDFKRIAESDFKNYYYEPFVATLKKQQHRDMVMGLYREGIRKNLLKPQFHGREHVHTDHWLQALREGDKRLREVFDEGMFTYYKDKGSNCRKEYLDAMATYNESQFSGIENKIQSGLDLFEEIWGYRSKTVIAPCYIWSRNIESFFHKYGIQLIQSGRCQKEPVHNQQKYRIIRRYTGQKNQHGQVYTIRNVMFEPASDPGLDWVDKAMQEISTAFLWKKPAIISTHRVNFVGSINPDNRDNNLSILKDLLIRITKNWPEVEFMSSDHLADLILDN